MALTYARFEKKYLESCMDIIRNTWKFDKDFKNPKKPEYVYKYYVLDCVNWSEHLDLLVDEDGRAQGILFGSIERPAFPKKMKFLLTQWKLRAEMWWHILNGDFGDRKQAVAVYKDMRQIDADGESKAEHFDSEVNLFILSPTLRGQGYGRQLMDRYMDFCRENHLKKAFLWTTTGCTWQFYERYGFHVYQRFTHQGLSSKEAPKTPNAMIYCKEVC